MDSYSVTEQHTRKNGTGVEFNWSTRRIEAVGRGTGNPKTGKGIASMKRQPMEAAKN